jgi:acetylglutamate kinase
MLKLVGMNPGDRARRRPADRRPAEKMGIQSEFRQGMRVTDERVMNVVEMVLGELNQEIVGLINQQGGKAVGPDRPGRRVHPCAQDAAEERDQCRRDRRHRPRRRDRAIDPELISLLDSRDFIPVVAPIGVGDEGEPYNINADLGRRQARRDAARREARADDQHDRRARQGRAGC